MNDKELIEYLCEENEAFAKDLANGHDLISIFDGHFVAWDEIIEACGNGMEGYGESPLELISRIINERDELRTDLNIQIERQQRMVFKTDYDADIETARLQGHSQGIQVALDVIEKNLAPGTAAIIRRILLESV